MNIVIIGGGGHGRVIVDVVERAGGFQLLGILDSELPKGTDVLGYPVLGFDSDLAALIDQHPIEGVIVAIGDNWLRAKAVDAVRSHTPTIEFPNAVHPSAVLGKNVRLGPGNVLMAGCVINASATIGDFCILNTNCSVDHACQLGNFVSFAPNACAGGSVHVGDYSAVSLGANIIHNVMIGSHTIVGAGATVVNDLPSQVVAFGTPARIVRRRAPGDAYL